MRLTVFLTPRDVPRRDSGSESLPSRDALVSPRLIGETRAKNLAENRNGRAIARTRPRFETDDVMHR